MRISFEHFLILCLLISGCRSEKDNRTSIAGIYVNTYTAEVMDPATGKLWGKRTIRDTLFIETQPDGFEISNKKWMYNTYDGRGWVTSMQGESESLPTYFAKFDPGTYSLMPPSDNAGPLLFVESDKVHLGEARALTYLKVE
jgi:uncharacterized protein YceK